MAVVSHRQRAFLSRDLAKGQKVAYLIALDGNHPAKAVFRITVPTWKSVKRS
jgi:hypothetical protein